MKKIDPNGETYRRRMIQTALDYCPPIYPCKKCGNPVISGYCCGSCGDGNPGEEEDEE